MRGITGGSINKVYAVQTKKQTYLLKVNHQASARFFECEAAGLDEIKNTQTINVPEVFAYKDRRTEGEAGYLLAEWIQGEKTKDTERMLGEKLAALHGFPVPKKYGLEQDNFIGSLPQPNGVFSSWTVYFLKKRILPQVERGRAETEMHTARKQKLW
ncbi:fructosamine kinase family protein [Fictibacillus terranigra]|uniref:fructosamine kinase family protein n=1 Tax=Fictibacillus terranigra TaxID=3058424 RepID=UPI0033906947